MGFDGKSLINPKQIRWSTRFSPRPRRRSRRRRRWSGLTGRQRAAGVGVFTVDGKMIDIAFIPGRGAHAEAGTACGMYEGDLV